MNKIIFDTETTGMPTNWQADHDDISVWPRIVEIAWIVINENDEELHAERYIIKPDNFVVPIEASNVHGITTDIAYSEGTELKIVLNRLKKDLDNANLLIAHNIDFDYPILNCEFKRLNLQTNLNQLPRFCTMKTDSICLFCNLGSTGKKWPKLRELYFALFNTNFENAHSAINDARATSECYVELKRREIIFEDNLITDKHRLDSNFYNSGFSQINQKPARVLLVEPHPTLRTVLVQRLRQDGHLAAAVGSAAEAVDLCRDEPIDLLVSDDFLEDNITAIELAIKINTQVFVLTSRSGVDDLVSFFDEGAEDVLRKPFGLEEFAARCRRLVKWVRILRQENK